MLHHDLISRPLNGQSDFCAACTLSPWQIEVSSMVAAVVFCVLVGLPRCGEILIYLVYLGILEHLLSWSRWFTGCTRPASAVCQTHHREQRCSKLCHRFIAFQHMLRMWLAALLCIRRLRTMTRMRWNSCWMPRLMWMPRTKTASVLCTWLLRKVVKGWHDCCWMPRPMWMPIVKAIVRRLYMRLLRGVMRRLCNSCSRPRPMWTSEAQVIGHLYTRLFSFVTENWCAPSWTPRQRWTPRTKINRPPWGWLQGLGVCIRIRMWCSIYKMLARSEASIQRLFEDVILFDDFWCEMILRYSLTWSGCTGMCWSACTGIFERLHDKKKCLGLACSPVSNDFIFYIILNSFEHFLGLFEQYQVQSFFQSSCG